MRRIATVAIHAGIVVCKTTIRVAIYTDKSIVHAAKLNNMRSLNERLWLRLQ